MSRGLTDEQYQAQRARIDALAHEWIPLLGLADWDIRLDGDASGAMAAEYGERADSPTFALMDCNCSWEYMQAVVRVNLIEAQNVDAADLEESFVHELCHALVCELRPPELDAGHLRHEERVVTMLSRAFTRVKGTRS